MTTCQTCGVKILGPERYCRNCGARVPVLVEDLADTHEFNPASPGEMTIEYQRPREPERQPSNAPATTRDFGAFDRIAAFIRRLMRRKLAWLALFLLLVIFIPSGLVVGRSMVRAERAKRAEQAREAARIKQDRQIKQTEVARRASEDAIQKALGFKPEAVSQGEYPDVIGVFVASLTSDYSPAARAGIRAGDVLTEFGGKEVPGGIELAKTLEPLKAGSEVAIKLYRDGEVLTSSMRINDRTTPPIQPKIEPRDEGFLGLGDVTRRCCAPGTRKWGLEVRRVVDNSPADLAGLQLGDLITEFDGHPTLTPDEFARWIHAAKPRSKVKIKFYRGNTEQTVELTLGHGWGKTADRVQSN
jgi:membrane-associated protease RseP (regulator of RpoE activity)